MFLGLGVTIGVLADESNAERPVALHSAQAGKWSDADTWHNGKIPGPGGVATVTTEVIVDRDTVVGHSPAAGAAVCALLVTDKGTLTVARGVTLTVRGDLVVSCKNAQAVVMQPGSHIVFDPSKAEVPSESSYRWAHTHGSAGSVIKGTAETRCSVSTNTRGGGAPAAVTVGRLARGLTGASDCDFRDLGDAKVPAVSTAAPRNTRSIWRNCTFERTGSLKIAASGNTNGHVILENNKFRKCAGKRSLELHFYAPMKAGGKRVVSANAFDKLAWIFTARDSTINNNFFHEGLVLAHAPVREFTGNFVRHPKAGGSTLKSSVKDCYWLEDHTHHNPHGFGVSMWSNDAVVEGVVMEYTGKGGAGDFIFAPNGKGKLTIRKCILLPNIDGRRPGKILAGLGGPHCRVSIEHCTYISTGGGETGVAFGETYDGHANMLLSLKSNIAWQHKPGRGGYKFNRIGHGNVLDLVSAENADYNCGWNQAPGTEGKGYNSGRKGVPLFSKGKPGVHDVDVDPQFIDPDRDLASWAVSRGSKGRTEAEQRADALRYLADDPHLTVKSLLPYIREGFTPRNPALKGAAHDGGDIGAVPVKVE